MINVSSTYITELPTSCPANYTWTFGISCYKFVSEKKNWFEASKDCRADGANLVAMETANENAFLRNYIKSSNHLKNAVSGKKSNVLCLSVI